jgi:hypothetical protein
VVEPLAPAYLDLKAASAWCCLSTRSLRRAIEAGQLKAFRRGGKILVRVPDLQTWVEAQEYRAPDLVDLDGIVAGVKAK